MGGSFPMIETDTTSRPVIAESSLAKAPEDSGVSLVNHGLEYVVKAYVYQVLVFVQMNCYQVMPPVKKYIGVSFFLQGIIAVIWAAVRREGFSLSNGR
jgi:hypothetical protein